MANARRAATDRGPEPVEERAISDVETLKALSDPLRLRIIEVMTASADETFTVKRLATILGANQTKLYHHVGLLVERGLLNTAGQRVVSGIIETSYRIGQRNLRLDRSMLATDTTARHEALSAILDGAREDIERGLRTGAVSIDQDAPPPVRLVLGRSIARLDDARATEFRDRLARLIDDFGATDGADGGTGAAELRRTASWSASIAWPNPTPSTTRARTWSTTPMARRRPDDRHRGRRTDGCP